MSDNVFLRDEDYYKRDINPLNHYVKQASVYLSKMTGDDIEKCRDYVVSKLKTDIVNPVTVYFNRNENGDVSVERNKLSQYIRDICSKDLILAPTFTCYKKPSILPSKLVSFVDENKKKRSKAKKEAFVAKTAGQTVIATMKDNEQANMKIYNNSLSGAFGSPGSVFYNPTAHSTLTSTIRTVSSFGNASNERVVMGNRHFFNEDIVLYNLNCYCAEIDRDEIQAVVNMFNLKIPTIDDVMDTIEYSTRFYFNSKESMNVFRQYVEKMDDIERAAFCYIGDLYRIRVLNNDFIKTFLEEISEKVTGIVPDALSEIKKIDEQVLNYAHQIVYSDVKGLGKEYHKMPEEIVSTLVLTSKNIISVLNKYSVFIKSLFLTKMVPASHAHIQYMMRRSVVLSDTDSTCFSTDDWMLWYFGGLNFTDKAFAICGAVSFIATQAIFHMLAILSANINTTKERLHDLAMKNEFLWTVHMPANVAKHYAAWTVMQEGSVYKKPSLEIKGVHLKSSATPPAIVAKAHEMIKNIFLTIERGNKISILEYIKEVVTVEQNIIASLTNREYRYYRSSKIKDSSAYSLNQEDSPYQHYLLWINVFQQTYGNISPPPYEVLVIPTILNNRTRLLDWMNNMQDKQLAKRMGEWLAKKNKTSLDTLYISTEYIIANGIPDEVVKIIDINKITLNLTLIFRIILESIGFYPKTDMLVSQHGIV